MRTYVVTLVAILMLLPAISMAQHCDLLRQAKDLELTDQQVEQIKANMLAEQKAMVQYRADLEVAEIEFRELMSADKLDKSKILSKSDEVSNLRAKMEKKRLESRIDRMNVLTDEQRGKLRKERMFFGGGPRGGKGGPGGGGPGIGGPGGGKGHGGGPGCPNMGAPGGCPMPPQPQDGDNRMQNPGPPFGDNAPKEEK